MKLKHLTLITALMCILPLQAQKFPLSNLSGALSEPQTFEDAILTPAETSAALLPNIGKFANVPLLAATDLQKGPAAKAVTPVNEAQWTDWREFSKVSVGIENPWAYSEMFGNPPAELRMMIRDDMANPGRSQLSLPGLFGQYDMIGEYDPATTEIKWQNINTGDYFPGMSESSTVPVVINFGANSSQTLNPKRIWVLNVWFLFICSSSSVPDMGYNFEIKLTPESYVPAGFDLRCPTLLSTNNFTFDITEIFGNIDKIRYAIAKEPYAKISLDAAANNNSELVTVYTEDTADRNNMTVTLSVEESGPYSLTVCGIDADGDYLTTHTTVIYAELPENGKWKSIGTGFYTDELCRGMLDQIIEERLALDLTYPAWIDEAKQGWNVEVEESVATPGLYRVKNPYRGHFETYTYTSPYGYESGVIVDNQNNYYLIIHAENPDNIWVEQMPSGVKAPGADGWTYYNVYYNPYAVPATGSSINCGNSGKYVSVPQNFELVLPSAIDCRFNMSATQSAIIVSDFGPDVNEIRYLLAPYGTVSAMEAYDNIKQGQCFTTYSPGELNTYSMIKNSRYDIYAISYNASGEPCVDRQLLDIVLYDRNYIFKDNATWNDPLFGFEKDVELYTASEVPDMEFVTTPYNYTNLQLVEPKGFLPIVKFDDTRWYLAAYTVNFNGTEYVITSAAEYFLCRENTLEAVENAGYIGTISNGEYRIKGLVFRPVDSEDWSWITQDEVWLLRTSDFKDYGFTLTVSDNDEVMIESWGEDISEVRYAAMYAGSNYSFSLRDVLTDPASYTGFKVGTATGAGSLDLSILNLIPDNDYIIGALSFNAAGEPEIFQSVDFTVYPELEELGTGRMNELFISGQFDIPSEELEFSVFRQQSKPGMYYLLNPYGVQWQNAVGWPESMTIPGGKNYLIVDATDNDNVFIRKSKTGLSYQNMRILLNSITGLKLEQPDLNISREERPGKKTDNIITIPGDQLFTFIAGKYYFSSTDPTLTIVLPDNEGIENVVADHTADDYKVEYFDITGRRVATPARGNLYIRKSGTTVDKIVF